MLEENKNYSDIELIEIVKSTTKIETLNQLKSHSNPIVRRAVARNKYVSQSILKYLINDPVLNVSYMVQQNPSFNIKRDFIDTSNPCVGCLEDERYRDCDNCTILKEYYGTDK